MMKLEATKVYDVTKDSSDGKIKAGSKIFMYDDGDIKVIYNGKVDIYSPESAKKLSMDFNANENNDYDYFNNGNYEDWFIKGSYTKEEIDIDSISDWDDE